MLQSKHELRMNEALHTKNSESYLSKTLTLITQKFPVVQEASGLKLHYVALGKET